MSENNNITPPSQSRPFTMDDVQRMVGSMALEIEALRRENAELRNMLVLIQTNKVEAVKK
jgi:hypothetical protein